jgi:hypothetical protein
MKVLIYSKRRNENLEQITGEGGSSTAKGWIRGGEEISYFQNNYKRDNQKNYYTLTFTH